MERKIFQELKAGHKFKYQFENVVQIKHCHSNLEKFGSRSKAGSESKCHRGPDPKKKIVR